MIIVKGKRYVRNDKEMINLLFTSKRTAEGFYKVNKRSITLYDLQKNRIVRIKKNEKV